MRHVSVFVLSAFLYGILSLASSASGKGSKTNESRGDLLKSISASLRQSACLRIEFISVTSSDVFRDTDTIRGSALFASDRRYLVRFGDDWTLRTGDSLYSYAAAQEQGTIQSAQAAAPAELSVLRRLDDLYRHTLLSGDTLFHLERKPGKSDLFPAELDVCCSRKKQTLQWLEFLSENGDHVHLQIVSLKSLSAVPEEQFRAVFPPRTEIIRLP